MTSNSTDDYKGKYKTSIVEITTETDVAGDDQVQLNTEIRYMWNGKNAHNDTVNSIELRYLRCMIYQSDEHSLMDAWDALFDRITRVKQCIPRSITWRIIDRAKARDVETVVRIVAHELRIPLSAEMDERQMVMEELGIEN